MSSALKRGIQVLDCFTPSRPTLSLTEIANRLDIPKATAHRLVGALEAIGCLLNDDDTGKYRLGIATLEWASAFLAGLRYPDVAQLYLERLADTVHESVSMAILDHREIVYVARVATRRVMSVNLSVGSRLPAHCTSMGRVLLADMEPAALHAYLQEAPLEAYTAQTVTSPAQLAANIARIGELGYALTSQELEVGLTSVAAPVRGPDGRVVAAINVSTFTPRYKDGELVDKVVPELVATAQAISSALGYRPGTREKPLLVAKGGE